jgi:hypothetical protein
MHTLYTCVNVIFGVAFMNGLEFVRAAHVQENLDFVNLMSKNSISGNAYTGIFLVIIPVLMTDLVWHS